MTVVGSNKRTQENG